MANIFTNLAVPAGDGVGAGSDTSAMGRKRTITVQNAFTGIVTIEFSNEAIGGPYAQAITFYAPGKKTIDIAAQFMRVRRAAAGGVAPNVDVSSNDNGGQFIDLPAPAGDGVGAAVNVSAFGTFNTIAVLGTWEGVVTIEISEDNASWAQCATLQNPGYVSAEFIAQFMRVRRAGTTVLGLPPGLPNVDVGAIDDPVSAGVPSDTAGIASNTLVFQPGGGGVGPAVFATWPALIAQLAVLRAAAGGNTEYNILFDDSVVTPAVIPVGAYDMEHVTFTGGTIAGAGGVQVEVNVADGATFTNLNRFFGNLRVTSLSAVTPPRLLVANDLIEISDGATVRSTAAAPFFDDAALGAGAVVILKMDNVATLGDGTNAAINIDGTAVLVLSMGSQAEVLASALDVAAGATLIATYRDLSSFINGTQAAMLGTLTTTVLTPERWRMRGPFVGVQNANPADVMQCDPSGGGFPINLPAVTAFNRGQTIIIKNITGSVNAIAVTPNGADTIDGVAAAVNIATGFASLTLVSDGASGWAII
jgi:hypothetical protein